MKMGLIALALILIILILLFSYNQYLFASTNHMAANIKNMNSSFEKNNLKQAYNYCQKVKNKWRKSEKIIQFLTVDEELDNIEEIFTKLDSCFQKGNYDGFYEATYKLNFCIINLYKKNLITVETVF